MTVKIQPVPLRWDRIKKENRWFLGIDIYPTRSIQNLIGNKNNIPMFQLGEFKYIENKGYILVFETDFSAN